MKFTGVVKVITPKESGDKNGKAWEKQSIVIEEVADKYPQSVLVEAFNKTEEVAKIEVGDTVDVLFNVSAKEYNGRYFGSNGLWKFDNIVKAVKEDIPF